MNHIINSVKLLIASRNEEDHEVIMSSLLGQTDFQITGIANDEIGAIVKTEVLKPDIIILDLQLSEITGPGIVKAINRRSPSTAIIFICDKKDRHDEVYASLSAVPGISGFLFKETDIDKLTHILRIIKMGGNYINASVTIEFLHKAALINNKMYCKIEKTSFTLLECNILELLACGFNDTRIAGELNYSTGTIRNYLTGIREKIKMKTRVEIVNYSYASGILQSDHLQFKKNPT